MPPRSVFPCTGLLACLVLARLAAAGLDTGTGCGRGCRAAAWPVPGLVTAPRRVLVRISGARESGREVAACPTSAGADVPQRRESDDHHTAGRAGFRYRQRSQYLPVGLLGRPLADRNGQPLGKLADVIVRLRGAEYPLVTGLVGTVGGREVFVRVDQVSSFDGEVLKLTSAGWTCAGSSAATARCCCAPMCSGTGSSDVAPIGLVGVDVTENVQGLEDPPVHRYRLAERGRVPVPLEHRHDVEGPDGAGVDGGDDPEDVLPVPADLRQVDPAAGEGV